MIKYKTGFNLGHTPAFEKNKFDFFIKITGMFLTVMSLFISLPSSKNIEVIRKYRRDLIIVRTLSIGIVCSVFGLVLTMIEVLLGLQSVLFIIVMTETILATIWLYGTFRSLVHTYYHQ